MCVCPTDECKTNIRSDLSSVFGVDQLLMEISHSLAAKYNISVNQTAEKSTWLCTAIDLADISLSKM